MPALLLFLGAILTYTGSYTLAARQRRTEARIRLYLDVLPEIRHSAQQFLEIADQEVNVSPQIRLAEDARWPGSALANPTYRYGVLCGRRFNEQAVQVHSAWLSFVDLIDRMSGERLNDQLIGRPEVVKALRLCVDSIDELSASLERSLRGMTVRTMADTRRGYAHRR